MVTKDYILTHVWTRYHGPTNSRGARISVHTASGLKVVVSYDHGAKDAHEAAVRKLLPKLLPGAECIAAIGDTPDRRGSVYLVIRRLA